MTHSFEPREDGGPRERRIDSGRSFKQNASLVAAVVLGVALVILIFSNTDSTPVSWFGFEAEMPLWIVLLLAAVAGVLLWPLVRALIRGIRGGDDNRGRERSD
jgi:uncharacterized integral membrane protein